MKLSAKIFIASCIAWASAQAQLSLPSDQIGGPPMGSQNYVNIKGSPYLLETWEKGSVTMASGQKFEDIELMFDQVANQILFKDSKGEVKAFNQPIVSFIIGQGAKQHIFAKGADGIFYENLVNGNTPLWKKNHKTLIDEKPYGSATVQRNVLNNNTYYVGELSKLTKIKNDKKSVIQVLSDKASEVEEYIKTEKLNPKTESDLARIFVYYNGL